MRIILSAIALTSVAAASIPPLCDNSTEALIEIQGAFLPGLVKIFENTGNDIYGLSSRNLFLDFVEFNSGVWQGCLPSDACFMAEITSNDESTDLADSITVKLGGNLVGNESFYSEFDTNKLFIEFGDCSLGCEEETESLLELDVYVGRVNLYSDWWIQDADGNREIECDQESNRCIFQTSSGFGRFHRIRQCLPSNQCHTFVAGDSNYEVWQYDPDFFVYFNLTYGGELVARRDGFRFEAIHFGNGCEEELACQNDNDSIFELFLFRKYFHDYELPDMSFQVKGGANVLSRQNLHSNDSLYYYRDCFPKESSLHMVLSVPETHNKTDVDTNYTTTYSDFGEIQLSFDDITYRDGSFYLGNEHGFNDTTYFGNTNDTDFCNDDELHLQVTFSVPQDDPNYYQRFNARVQYMNDLYELDSEYPVEFEYIFVGFMAGTTYRTTQCIATDECTEFANENNDDWPQTYEYIVQVNGQVQDERRQWNNHVVTTLGGEDCPADPLSSGAIAGIVIGSLAGAVILLVVAKRIRKANDPARRRASVDDSNTDSKAAISKVFPV